MSSGTYIAYSGAVAAQAQLDVVANNVANVSTSGYRRDQTLFDTILAGVPFAGAGQAQIDLSPGTHQLTKNPLNAAIDGKGFFVVQDESGTELYTRRGDFRLNAARELTLPNGMVVMGKGGALAIPQGTTPQLMNDGTLMTEHGPIGQLRIVEFADPAGLSKMGASLIAASPEAGLTDVSNPRVAAGFVEASNVSLAAEMVALLEATRAFEAALKSLKVTDEMTGSLIQANS